jgi:hypothetical protein
MPSKLLLILPLILFLNLSLASAEDEDPNASMPNQARPKTEAEPACITCDMENPKAKNQKDLEAVTKKAKSTKKKSAASCITCGRVSLNKPEKSFAGEDQWDHYPQISGYSNSSAVNAMIRYAERHAYRSSRGICYRNVKEALCGAPRSRRCKGPLVSNYLYGTPVFPELPSKQKVRIGKNALVNLKSEGFINLVDNPEFSEIIKNPASAPRGAILIYQGGKSGGHIEIKTGHGTAGSYVSDFRAPNSVMKNELAGRASRHYKLVGVMIKPVEKLL